MTTISGVGNLLDASTATQGGRSQSFSLLNLIPSEYAFLILLLTHATGCTAFSVRPPSPPDGGDGDADADQEMQTCALVDSVVRIPDASPSSWCHSLVWTGSEYGVAWDGVNSSQDLHGIYFIRLSANGIPEGSAVCVSNEGLYPGCPVLVWTGREYGLIWADERGSRAIHFRRVSVDGNPVGAETYVVDIMTEATQSLALVWTGREYGLSWFDYRGIDAGTYFTRISAEGIPLAAETLVAGSIGASPALIWNGNEYGLSRIDENGLDHYIYFTRISSDGNLIGSDNPITLVSNYDNFSPLPAWTGTEYGITWADWHDSALGIYFTRFSSEGIPVGSNTYVTNFGSNSPPASPSLVWNGSGYGMSWQSYIDSNDVISFVPLSALGEPIGSVLRVTNEVSETYEPSLVWTGSEYGEVWWGHPSDGGGIFFARVRCE